MVDEEVFKNLIHSDEAFKAFYEQYGAEETLENLNHMNMKITTQLAKWGDERESWFKRAKGLSVVIRNRIDETKNLDALKAGEYKEWAHEVVVALLNAGYSDRTPSVEDIDDLHEWLDETGL